MVQDVLKNISSKNVTWTMDIIKLFQCSQQIKPEDVLIVLTAATGVAKDYNNGISPLCLPVKYQYPLDIKLEKPCDYPTTIFLYKRKMEFFNIGMAKWRKF